MREDRNPKWSNETEGPSSEVMDTLAHVLRDQEERAKKRTETPPPREMRHHSRLLLGLLLLLASLSLYLWVFSPGWLSAPASQPPSQELLEAGTRMEVYLIALRIQSFREEAGRLPNSLEEAGDPSSGVEYERLDPQRFVLTLRGPAGMLTYRSWDSLDTFLGDAYQVIQEGA